MLLTSSLLALLALVVPRFDVMLRGDPTNGGHREQPARGRKPNKGRPGAVFSEGSRN